MRMRMYVCFIRACTSSLCSCSCVVCGMHVYASQCTQASRNYKDPCSDTYAAPNIRTPPIRTIIEHISVNSKSTGNHARVWISNAYTSYYVYTLSKAQTHLCLPPWLALPGLSRSMPRSACIRKYTLHPVHESSLPPWRAQLALGRHCRGRVGPARDSEPG
jgi:hypothetical protein